jgi:ribose transport system ATP-binding protein
VNILEMTEVKKTFGGIAALDGVNFRVSEGEIHGITGENGSGKSTLAHILAGIAEPDSGEISFCGTRCRISGPASSQALGIGVAYQDIPPLRGITIAQTIMMGREPHNRFGIIDDRRINEEAGSLLRAIGITDISPLDYAELLPERLGKFAGIARAVFLGTRLVIMDEPSDGLDASGMEKLSAIVMKLKNNGTPVILISRNPDMITGMCDRVTVLRGGRAVRTLESKDATPDELLRIMGTARAEYPSRPVSPGKTLLALPKRGIEIRQGETVGMNCADDARKTEIIRSILGIEPRGSGETSIFGIKMRTGPPGSATRYRIGLSQDERKLRCAALCVTARKASAYARVEHSPANAGERFLPLLQGFGLGRGQSAETETVIQNLFTPSQILGGRSHSDLIFGGADVVIFDEPSRGADEAAKVEIYNLTAELTARGKGILLFSLDVREIEGMCGRTIGSAERE